MMPGSGDGSRNNHPEIVESGPTPRLPGGQEPCADALESKRRAAAVYNAAADHYDDPRVSFWERFGRRTVSRLNLPFGARVLDVCCGTGAAALAAAEAVGPSGQVVGADLAANLLALARTKAAVRGLGNAEFCVADFEHLRLPPASWDAVLCVFGIFFAANMERAMRHLWQFVRPGGQLAITTWGPRLFEPAAGAFWEAVRADEPALHCAFNPWDRINTPERLRALLTEAEIPTPRVTTEFNVHSLGQPDDWWAVVLGSGYRGTVDALPPAARERVRQACIARLTRGRVGAIEANVIYAVATKPAMADR